MDGIGLDLIPCCESRSCLECRTGWSLDVAEGDGGINPCRVRRALACLSQPVRARHCSKSFRNLNSLNRPAALGEKHGYYANDGKGNRGPDSLCSLPESQLDS